MSKPPTTNGDWTGWQGFAHRVLAGMSHGLGLIAAIGIGAVVLAAGGKLLLASNNTNTTQSSCVAVGFTGFDIVNDHLPWRGPDYVNANSGVLTILQYAVARSDPSSTSTDRYIIHRWYDWNNSQDSIVLATKNLALKGKVVLVGFSAGGAAAVKLARFLSENDPPIHVAVLIENDTYRGGTLGWIGLMPRDFVALAESGVLPSTVDNDVNYYQREKPPKGDARYGIGTTSVENVPIPEIPHIKMDRYVADQREEWKQAIDGACYTTTPPPPVTPPPPDGSVVQQSEPGATRPTYRIEGGQKRKADLAVVQSCGWLNQVTTVPKAVLDKMPTGSDWPLCPTPSPSPSPSPPRPKACISGLVTRADNNAPIAAAMSITGPSNRNTATDSSGGYSACDLLGGSYTVTPQAEGFTFVPAQAPVALSSNVGGVNFLGKPGGVCIRGQVTTTAGASEPITGAVLTLSDGRKALSEANGAYSFCGTLPGAYRITAAVADADFVTPAFQDATVPPEATAKNFAASIKRPYCVTGLLTQSSGPTSPIAGIPLLVDGAQRDTSGPDGRYSVCGLAQGPHTVTPSHTDWVFGPTDRSVNGPPNQTAGFTGIPIPKFCISGFTTGSQGATNPIAGISVSASGPDARSSPTNEKGGYTLCGLREGNYTVSASSVYCGPPSRPVFLSGANQEQVNFVCTPPPTCASPASPVFPAADARVGSGQTVNLQWIGESGCKYLVTLFDGCGSTTSPLLNDASWPVAPRADGIRCGWFVQGVDKFGGVNSPAAQWYFTWGLVTPTPTPTTPTPATTTAVPTTAVPTTAVPTTAVPTTAVPTTAVPTTAVPVAPTITSLGCVGTGVSGLDAVQLANWAELFTCHPTVSGSVNSWAWSAPGGTPATGSSSTFSASWSSVGSKTISLRACNAGGCADQTQAVRLPNCDVSPYQGGPHVVAISPAPCGVVPAGQPITLRWSIDFAGQPPPSTMFMAVQMSECVPAGEGYGYGSNMSGENSATIPALPAGVRCRWRVRTTQNGTAEPGPVSLDFFFYVR